MMPRDIRQLGGIIACAVIALGSTIVATGCSETDAASRAQTLATPSARKLIGAWQVSFWLDRGATVTGYQPDSVPVVGTIVFAEDTHGLVSADELSNPTHDGVYDIDFSPFGFETRGGGDFPGAIARVTQVRLSPSLTSERDSLSIVLSPGTQHFSVWMSGTMSGDSAAGFWAAANNRSGGSSGHFVMRRQNQ